MFTAIWGFLGVSFTVRLNLLALILWEQIYVSFSMLNQLILECGFFVYFASCAFYILYSIYLWLYDSSFRFFKENKTK